MAINHKEADRVPIDFGSMHSSGMSMIAYNELRKEMGINGKLARMHDFIQQLAIPEQEVLDKFNVDVVDADRVFLKDDNEWREWELNDGSKCLVPKFFNIEITEDNTVYLKNDEGIRLGRKPASSLYIDQCWRPWEKMEKIPDIVTPEDLDRELWATPSPEFSKDIFDDKNYEVFVKNIKDLYDNTDYGIVLNVGCGIFEKGTYLRNFENFLVDIYTDKKGVLRMYDVLLEKYLRILERVIKGVGQYVDVMVFGGEDLGSNLAPFISPDKFVEIFKPIYSKLYGYVHDNCDAKVFIHSCGAIFKLIPHFIDAGVNIFNPVQTEATDMEPEKLKKEYGKDCTFWGGGADAKLTLRHGTPKEVKEDVKRRMEVFAKGGGFVFCQIHNILTGVPPKNVFAMMEAVMEYGGY